MNLRFMESVVSMPPLWRVRSLYIFMAKEKIMAKKTKWNLLMMAVVVVVTLVSAGCASVPPANWSMAESGTIPNEKLLLKRDPLSDGNAKSIKSLIELQGGTAGTWYVFTAPVERPGATYYGFKNSEWGIFLQIAVNNWVVEECAAPSPGSLIQLAPTMAAGTMRLIANELYNYSSANPDDFANLGWYMLTAPEKPGEIYYVYMRGSNGPVPLPAAQKEKEDMAMGAVSLLAKGLGGNSNPVKYIYRKL
jgi:hypothetical protein